jgi:hypothetical protein
MRESSCGKSAIWTRGEVSRAASIRVLQSWGLLMAMASTPRVFGDAGSRSRPGRPPFGRSHGYRPTSGENGRAAASSRWVGRNGMHRHENLSAEHLDRIDRSKPVQAVNRRCWGRFELDFTSFPSQQAEALLQRVELGHRREHLAAVGCPIAIAAIANAAAPF